MKTAIYLRVSTPGQEREGFSLEAQLDHINGFCKLQGITDTEVYSDGGYSGSSLDRPQMQRLITDIQIGKVDRLIVYKLDRLSRKTKDTLYLVEDVFNKHGVKFISITDNIDTSTSSGKFFVSILSSVAQLERENIKERSTLGKEKKAQKGIPSRLGTMPIGYDWDMATARYVINETEAEQVRKVFDMFCDEKSLYRIWQTMKTCNHKYGAYKDIKTFYNMLHNPVYIGKLKRNGLLYDSTIPPIITEEQFNKAAARIAKQKEEYDHYSSDNTKHLLTNFLWCGSCGARYAAHKHRHLPRYYYMCYSRWGCCEHMVEDRECAAKHVPVENLDKYVEARILALCRDFKKGLTKQAKPDESGLKAFIAAKQGEITEAEERLDLLLDLYLHKKIDKESYIRKSTELRQTKAKISQEVSDAKRTLAGKHTVSDEYIKTLDAVWAEGDLKLRREVLRKLIKKIVINDDKIEIMWRFRLATT